MGYVAQGESRGVREACVAFYILLMTPPPCGWHSVRVAETLNGLYNLN
jgi:hypothetical protein